MYKKFNEQLEKKPEGWYETGLIWNDKRQHLHNNERNSLARTSNLLRKLKSDPVLLHAYHNIIQDQLAEGIVEEAVKIAEGKEFYLPHRPVVKEGAESTKVRIVFDASARGKEGSPTLNECLETGPSLQNLINDILI